MKTVALEYIISLRDTKVQEGGKVTDVDSSITKFNDRLSLPLGCSSN